MSTSKLQRKVSQLLSTHLGQYTIRENMRPDWLGGLELDFFIEELDIAIEVQGAQHYRYIPHFHLTLDGFRDQLARDAAKRGLCIANGVSLYAITTEDEAIEAIEESASARLEYVPHKNHTEYLLALDCRARAKKKRRNQRTSARKARKARAEGPVKGWLKQIQKIEKSIAKASARGRNTTALQIGIDKRRDKILRYNQSIHEMRAP